MRQAPAATRERCAALDLLRGLAIGAMLFSGQLPRAVLPGWMYHAQNPPPLHAYSPWLAGITWVDLVFPLFLFAMGAAIPLSIAPRLAAGQGRAAAALGVVRRALVLALFAIYVRHISPHVVELGAPWRDACYALAGLLTLFAMLAPGPRSWPPARLHLLRLLGLGGACALMLLFRDVAGAGFSFARSDTILLVLANVALGGGLLYLFTARRPLWRLAFLAVLLALRLGHEAPGWAAWLWGISPLPGLAPVAFQQYLFTVVPGIFAGECLLRLGRRRSIGATRPGAAAALACWGMVAACTIGLYARELLPGAAVAMLLCACFGARALRRRAAPLRRLYAMGVVLLLLGLCFDPFEGGTQKGVATLSYYLVGAASGCLVLLALMALPAADGIGAGAGRNPMFAYIGLHTLVTPLLVLSGLDLYVAQWSAGALGGTLRALLLTLLVCVLAARRGLLLRA